MIALVVVLAVGFSPVSLIPSLAAQPENLPGKDATATAIVKYLNSLTNLTTAKLISGQHDQTNEITSIVPQVNYLHQKTGKWVGIYAANLRTRNVDVVANLTTYWNNGGLVSAVVNPANPACELATCSSPLRLAPYTADQLVTPGTSINNQFLRDLDAIEVPRLTRLKDAGVVVLFRWMAEMDVDKGAQCFDWWNCTLDGSRYVTLFKQVHDYLVYAKGLNNLVWVLAFSHRTNPSLPAQYYPGSAYVDVVGEDLYMETPSDAPVYNAIAAFGKPVALTEFGPGDEAAVGRGGQNCHVYYDYRKMLAGIKANFPKAVYFVAWGGCWGMYVQNDAGTMLRDPYVINRDALPLFSRGRR
jgi:mannan endo-1,4-beta-mannosidase